MSYIFDHVIHGNVTYKSKNKLSGLRRSQRLVSLTLCTTHCQKADFSAGGGQKVYSSTVTQ